MIEKIKLHGGPRHGLRLDIPADHGDEIGISVPARKGDVLGQRLGHYTRVHSIGNQPSHDFEWSGYTQPFTPAVAEAHDGA